MFSSTSGGCHYVVLPQLFLSCFLSSRSFAGSAPSRPADLPWAETNPRNHTHTHTHWVCLSYSLQKVLIWRNKGGVYFTCNLCARAFLRPVEKLHAESCQSEQDDPPLLFSSSAQLLGCLQSQQNNRARITWTSVVCRLEVKPRKRPGIAGFMAGRWWGCMLESCKGPQQSLAET